VVIKVIRVVVRFYMCMGLIIYNDKGLYVLKMTSTVISFRYIKLKGCKG
jgi:hypothetical protein